MASITELKADLAELAQRLQSVANALKSLPADHLQRSHELEVLREEIRAVATQIRGK